MQKLGVIGLGRMGSAIAERLAGQGVNVTGWTRSGLGSAGAAKLGIARAETLADLAAGSDILITSLYDDIAVGEVLDTLATLPLTGKLIIDTSTITPSTLTSRAEALKADLVDAPIAGGPEMVLAGSCSLLLGGAPEAAARALPILRMISDRAVLVGPLGAGLVMKCINNGILQTYFAGLFEQVKIAKRAGLDLEIVLRILCSGPVALPAVIARLPKILGEDTTVGFPVSGALKDNEVFHRIAEDLGVPVPALGAARAMGQYGVANGLAEMDPAGLIAHAYHSA